MESTTVRLYGTATWNEASEVIRGLAFEQMQKLAQPVVQHYYGDMYRAAIWIGGHINGPGVFFYSFDTCGVEVNHMNNEADAVWFLGRKHRYRLDLRADYSPFSEGATWYLDINKLNDTDDITSMKTMAGVR